MVSNTSKNAPLMFPEHQLLGVAIGGQLLVPLHCANVGLLVDSMKIVARSFFLYHGEKKKSHFPTVHFWLFNPEMSGRVKLTHPLCGFFKNASSIERVEPCPFVTFNITSKHIFPENFVEFPQIVQKIWRNSLSMLGIFVNFPPFFFFLFSFFFLTLTCYKEINSISL